MSLMTGRFFLLFAQVVVAVNTFKGCSQPLMSGLELLRLFLGEIKGFPEVWLRFWLLLVGSAHAGAAFLALPGLAFAVVSAFVFLAIGGFADGFAVGFVITITLAIAVAHTLLQAIFDYASVDPDKMANEGPNEI